MCAVSAFDTVRALPFVVARWRPRSRRQRQGPRGVPPGNRAKTAIGPPSACSPRAKKQIGAIIVVFGRGVGAAYPAACGEPRHFSSRLQQGDRLL